MYRAYSNQLKDTICHRICVEKASTSRTAKEYDIPLKTVEKWITAYNKDPERFKVEDDYHKNLKKVVKSRYEGLNAQQLIFELKKRDTEIGYLKSVLKSQMPKNDFNPT